MRLRRCQRAATGTGTNAGAGVSTCVGCGIGAASKNSYRIRDVADRAGRYVDDAEIAGVDVDALLPYDRATGLANNLTNAGVVCGATHMPLSFVKIRCWIQANRTKNELELIED
ncbi:hypothetical protein [Duganella sp. Root336D2]|uniref:hypothetical protein n=1 Tax=Duganella sp. Root336D2 TaxID=1736518 RepID=UPI0012E3DA05|nr:hypothetical protein [Duganella sp. Root336D2]